MIYPTPSAWKVSKDVNLIIEINDFYVIDFLALPMKWKVIFVFVWLYLRKFFSDYYSGLNL